MYLSVLKRYMFLISMKLCYNFLDKHQLLIMECLSVLKLQGSVQFFSSVAADVSVGESPDMGFISFFKLINFNENEQNQTRRLIFLKTTGGGGKQRCSFPAVFLFILSYHNLK